MSARIVIVLLFLSITSPIRAADKGPGLVQNIYTLAGGAVVFNLSGPVTGGWPACAIAQRYAINTTTVAGQAQLATLLSARFSGTPVSIQGAGNCSAWFDSETVNYVNVQ